MNFMYRDNGLNGATRRSIDTSNKKLQMKLYQEYKIYSDHEMAEKREIVRQYEQKYNGKLFISVVYLFVVTCNDYHIRVNSKLELLTLLEYKITLRRQQLAATKI